MNDEAPPKLNPVPTPRHGAWAWWVFIGVLLAPPLLMALVARSEDAQGAVLTLGAGASAMYCGIWLARRLFAARGITLQVVMAVVFFMMLFPVSVVLCCVGCTLGGGEFNIH